MICNDTTCWRDWNAMSCIGLPRTFFCVEPTGDLGGDSGGDFVDDLGDSLTKVSDAIYR